MEVVGRFFDAPRGHYFLFGPRGTGKSTWIASAYPTALWVNLLAPETHRALAARPERLRELIAANPDKKVIVIDEVQRLPPLLDVVHEQIEARRGTVRFIMTGSSARKLKRAGVNLLAGRALSTALHPFMAAELGDRFDLDRVLNHGLVPLVWSAEDPGGALNAYLSLYIREEVQAEGLVRNLGAFTRFLEAISLSHGGVLNLANVARECEISRKTVEGYLSILEDLLLAFRIPVFSRKAKRHLIVHSKFYWFDVGVYRSARPAGPLDRPEEIGGAALEGLVAQHLRAWIDYSGKNCALYFWRTKSGTEVDFVIYGRDGFWALEVKNTARIQPADLRGLRGFREEYPGAACGFVYRGTERIVVDGIICIPCDEFLRQLRPDHPFPIPIAP
jgi:predicted AAA+ superfamily ATPase